MTLVEFLRVRLDEDEQAARECGGVPWVAPIPQSIHVDPRVIADNKLAFGHLGHVATVVHDHDRQHIASWDPARVLAEVEAKRELLRLHGRMSVTPGHPYFNDAHLTREPMVLCRSCEPETMWRRERSWPCRTLKTLALPYADHPDYDPAWRT